MANSQVWTIPGKAHSVAKEEQKTRNPMSLVQRLKKLLAIPEHSERSDDDPPYFGM